MDATDIKMLIVFLLGIGCIIDLWLHPLPKPYKTEEEWKIWHQQNFPEYY